MACSCFTAAVARYSCQLKQTKLATSYRERSHGSFQLLSAWNWCQISGLLSLALVCLGLCSSLPTLQGILLASQVSLQQAVSGNRCVQWLFYCFLSLHALFVSHLLTSLFMGFVKLSNFFVSSLNSLRLFYSCSKQDLWQQATAARFVTFVGGRTSTFLCSSSAG